MDNGEDINDLDPQKIIEQILLAHKQVQKPLQWWFILCWCLLAMLFCFGVYKLYKMRESKKLKRKDKKR